MITSDTNFRGNFDSIEAVWEAIPYGGVEGDYLNIQGVKYRWNKYLAMWENAEVVTETPARETVTFDEDVNMQNNLTVAGVLRAKKFVVDDLPTGIEDVEITESAVSGGNNVITFTYTNGESQTFIIKNGEAGKTQAAFAVVADALDKTGWDTAKCYLVLTETEGEFDVYSYENEAWNKIDTIEIDLNYDVVQTTGQSTTSVMSQKAVTDEITIQGTFNLSSATYPSNIISGSGKWASVSGASSILIPVVSGEAIHVVGNGNAAGTIYAFLKTNVTTTGTTPSFATGYSDRVVAAGDAIFDLTAPADANYLWFMYKNADGSMMPALYSPKNIADIIEETNVYDNTMIDLSLCADSHRSITQYNLWAVADNAAYSILLPVSEGEVYEIVAGENGCIYSFLTDADLTAKNNSAVSFVTGYGSRISVSANQKKAITIPTSCKYICFTSHIAGINFLPKLYKKSSSNIIDNVGDVNKIKDTVFGKDISLYMSWDRAINGSNKWYVPATTRYQSKIIPVNEGDFMTLFANSQIAQHYAFLTATDASAKNGSNVSFVAGYETRYEVADGRADFVIPQGCKFLYILTAEETDIFINNKPLQNLNSANNDESNYNLVYCNDFNDGIDGDFWKAVEWEGQMGSYTSRVLADDNNWYADSGCMVLKLEKRNGIYYGPYISTAKTFAINKGKIEVRVKCNVVNSALGWCFWTFGQNAVWPIPLEIDVFEKITNSDVQGVHYHYKGTDNTNKNVSPTSVTMNEFGTDWHTLGVEWDGFRIKTYYDGVMKSDTTISDSLYPFTYPQQLCFNIKCKDYDAGDAFLFVDYVKVWVDKDESPIIGFEQDDITLSVGGSTYINPTFVPSDCINKAFALTSDNENIVSVEEFEGGHENHFLQRKIVGVAAGVAHLTITAANGSTTKTFTVTVE